MIRRVRFERTASQVMNAVPALEVRHEDVRPDANESLEHVGRNVHRRALTVVGTALDIHDFRCTSAAARRSLPEVRRTITGILTSGLRTDRRRSRRADQCPGGTELPQLRE